MRGSVYRRCWCKDPATGKRWPAGDCPKLRSKRHGKWYYRYEAPRIPGTGRRQPQGGPFGTKAQADEELTAALAKIDGGGTIPDKQLKVSDWLSAYLTGKINLKARTLATDTEAFRLYWSPALGHMRVTDLRARHIAQVIAEMLKINRPLPPGEEPSEMLLRMLAARADDERRVLPEGETRHKKSPKPLSPARVVRMFAPFRACCNTGVPAMWPVSPCAGVEMPARRMPRPIGWTRPREAKFRAGLDKRIRAASATRKPTTVEMQEMWSAPDLRPSAVMVWTPEHTGRFLEHIAGERLFALYCLAAFCGLRRDEIIGAQWSDVDLDQRTITVLETGGGQGTKSDASDRVVPLPPRVVAALRAWRKVQAAEQMAYGAEWDDTGLVFTREDGSQVPGQWVSVRFETLAYRAGLPPVRFHDLRHGAASICKAAGLETKVISAILGHTRTSFTDATYVFLFPEVAQAGMDAAAKLVPRSARSARGLHGTAGNSGE
jgi:integrase